MAPSEKAQSKFALEGTYLKLKEAYKAITREFKPNSKETSQIQQNLLQVISARKRSIEKVMQKKPEFSFVIPRDMPRKLGDPGNFTIPCKVNGKDFPTGFIDLGSSVNIMPRSTAIELELKKFRDADFALVMADNSRMVPLGIAINVPVQIGDDFVLQDFAIVEMESNPADPITFGRPFMTTTGMKLDMGESSVELNMGQSKVKFYMGKPEELPAHTDSDDEDDTSSDTSLPELLVDLDEHAEDCTLQELHKELVKKSRKPAVVRSWPKGTGPGTATRGRSGGWISRR